MPLLDDKKIKIVCISDTHTYHRRLKIPKCDLLIATGDYSNRGERHVMEDFEKWLGELKENGTVKETVCIVGNHELTYCPDKTREFDQSIVDILEKSDNCHYLNQTSVELFGFKIYGDPRQPEFCGWGHNVARGQELFDVWQKIPDDVDFLLSHGPSYMMADFIPLDWAWKDGMPVNMDDVRRVGCEDLANRIKELKNLKLHVSGHIHCSFGVFDKEETKSPFTDISATEAEGMGTVFVNASICTEAYSPTNPPIVIEMYKKDNKTEDEDKEETT